MAKEERREKRDERPSSEDKSVEPEAATASDEKE